MKKPKKRYRVARAIVFCAFILLTCVGLATTSGTGTISAWGWDIISTICPLGALETALAGHRIVPRLLITLAVMIVVVLIVGKGFCAWACPAPRLRSALTPKRTLNQELADNAAAGEESYQRNIRGEKPRRRILDSRHLVLAGALGSSLAFGFPVFCLVCPVGLTFGTIILLWRLLQFNQWTWAIVIFPVIVILEVVFLKRWCGSICPIGGLLSLISRGNVTLRPKVDSCACLRNKGKHCVSCASACPEHIDVVADYGENSMNECVKCGRCIESCPAQAVSFKLLSLAKSSSAAEDNR